MGQQNTVELTDGPAFINPANYSIPAGGTGRNGYSGPSLNLLVDAEKQTLVNGSVSIIEGQSSGGIISDLDRKLILSLYKNRRRLRLILMARPYRFTRLLRWTVRVNI